MQCLDDEYLGQALRTMNCSPPYLTDQRQLWCDKNVDKLSKEAEEFIWKFSNTWMDDGNCLPPCTFVK